MESICIAVLGAGTWGMALARMLSVNGHEVTVWSALPHEIEQYARDRVHPNLPGMTIPQEIVFTGDIQEACQGKKIVLFAVPSVYVRSTAKLAASFVTKEQILVDVAKGLEPDTLMTMSQVIEDELVRAGAPDVPVVALSGPTHAEEVALDLPTAIVAASRYSEAAAFVQQVFTNRAMRVYTNGDVLGVELCGALKNIIALAAGISAGLGFGDNAKAALITRGLSEIHRLGLCLGCREETFSGLAGVGDLIVTATSRHSRNNRAGFLIGSGKSAEEAKREVGMVVEGINAIPAAIALSKRCGVEMPITFAVSRIVAGRQSPREAVEELMGRRKRDENDREGYGLTSEAALLGNEAASMAESVRTIGA